MTHQLHAAVARPPGPGDGHLNDRAQMSRCHAPRRRVAAAPHFATDAQLATEPLHVRPDASDDDATGRCPSAGWWSVTRRDLFEAPGRTDDSIAGGGVTVP